MIEDLIARIIYSRRLEAGRSKTVNGSPTNLPKFFLIRTGIHERRWLDLFRQKILQARSQTRFVFSFAEDFAYQVFGAMSGFGALHNSLKDYDEHHLDEQPGLGLEVYEVENLGSVSERFPKVIGID